MCRWNLRRDKMSIDDATPKEWDAVAMKSVPTSRRTKDKNKKSLGSPAPDAVDHPPHYNQGKIESIDYIEDSLGEGFNYYLEGSIKKYLHRWRYKHGDKTEGCVEDLRKARWYLDRLIKNQVVDK